VRINKVFAIAATPARVAAVLCSEAYNVEEGNGRADVVSTRFRPLSDSDRQIRFEIQYTEYKRTKLGRIDKSGTVNAVSTCAFDRGSNTLEWSYRNEASDRISLRGTQRLEAQGDTTRWLYEADFEIRIPLIGEQIAKLAAREFDEDLPRVVKLLEQHATAA